MTNDAYRQIEGYIRESDLPRKAQKLEGLRLAMFRKHPLELRGDTLFLQGLAIDPSELENGQWL